VLCDNSSPVFDNVRFINNYAVEGGAVYSTAEAHPVFRNCQFIDNYAFHGGAVELSSGSATFEHCLFTGNYVDSGYGNAIYAFDADKLDIIRCTFADNSTAASPVLYMDASPTQLTSSIIANNGCSSPVESHAASLLVEYLDVFGNSSGDYVGTLLGKEGVAGNISSDPMFVDSSTGDYQLMEGSPCIDAGDPLLPLDPDQTIADIGAYYYHGTGGGPPPVPDGAPGTSPMLASRLDALGTQINVSWDDQCAPASAKIVYGPLSGVSSWTITDAVCAIDNPELWDLVPAGDLWFMLVSDDGAGVEGSWGEATAGERNGSTASNTCGSTVKDLTATCPN
jgi:predicted outer membrane repeat protein